MINPSLIQFLKELRKNNDRSWMEKNRLRYEESRDNFVTFVASLIHEIGSFDKDIASLEPKQCIFRINRDIRFSKNKAPYKTNFAAFFNEGGKKAGSAGYYIHIEPGASFLAGGIYMPEAPVLAAIRQEIDYNLADWEKIILNPGFKKIFNKGLDQEMVLSRPPKGYDADNPALAYLKLKSFTVSHDVDDQFFTNKNSIREITKVMKALHPMIRFLNQAAV